MLSLVLVLLASSSSLVGLAAGIGGLVSLGPEQASFCSIASSRSAGLRALDAGKAPRK